MSKQWRTIAEAERDPVFLARIAGEFPSLRQSLAHPVERRRALKLLAAGIALGGLGGCDPAGQDGHIIPAVIAPPNIIPALPNRYSTASVAQGTAIGVVVTHQMGRPIKVEGNPNHPASLGATDIHAQAMVLDFYDPDRSAGISFNGVPSEWQRFAAATNAERAVYAASHGAGLRLLTGRVVSPTQAAQIDALLKQYPEARWHQWDGIPRDETLRGTTIAYGRAVDVIPDLTNVDVLLALDSDLISSAPGHLKHARDLASRRNPTRTSKMSRIYAAEVTPSLTGATADHRFVVAPWELQAAVVALAGVILRNQKADGWIATVAADLQASPGRALIHAGPELSAEAQALVHAINEALGGRGRTFTVRDCAVFSPANEGESIRALAKDMHDGKVASLFISGTNPAFTAPRTIGFDEALRHVRFTLVSATSADETTASSNWSIPASHGFEAWGDALAFDGTATIMQPQALPLYGGRSVLELLPMLMGPQAPGSREAVVQAWRDGMDARGWHDALASGIVANTAHPALDLPLRDEAARAVPPTLAKGLSLAFRPDPNLWDGRHANNAWLQELPRPLTKLVWDNPLLISPATASKEGLTNGAEVTLTVGSAQVTAPVFMMPGQAPDVVTVLLGYGRSVVGSVGAGTGFDLFAIRDAAGPITLQRTGNHAAIATTDHHNVLDVGPEGIVKHMDLAAFSQGAHEKREKQPTLYFKPLADKQAWGMSIDLNACIGCNACVIACQAENNIPTVGKEQVLHEREMHWLRIDRYYEGGAAAPDSYFQPMLCMQCEEAPCEVVCPVGATVHDSEGLNVMVYNRCVGTRFCSNNCPYKVRRFNYAAFAQEEARPAISRNPDVSVRARGVMEKCTFCLQKIAEARIAADKENRPIRDGEVRTACQSACPTQAFSFGNIRDPESEVAKRKGSPLDYALLEDQATHPRVTYEALVRNPNPAITS